MKKQKHPFRLAIFTVLFSLFSLVAIKIFEEFKAEKLGADVSVKIQNVLDSGENHIVFSEIVAFQWDRLYIFGPYSINKDINSTLGQPFPRPYWQIEGEDGITLLAFMRNGKLVAYLNFPRGEADFSTVHRKTGYAVHEACFIMDRENGDVKRSSCQ